jgi:hypothetical protein
VSAPKLNNYNLDFCGCFSALCPAGRLRGWVAPNVHPRELEGALHFCLVAKFHSSLLNVKGYFSFSADTSDLLQHAWCAFVEPTMMRRLLARRSKESDSNDKGSERIHNTTTAEKDLPIWNQAHLQC